MQHFRDECETPQIAFLFVSDDMEWGRSELKGVSKKFGDVFFVGELYKSFFVHIAVLCGNFHE